MSARRLQHEIKEKQPFESAEREAVLNILLTADRLQNPVSDACFANTA